MDDSDHRSRELKVPILVAALGFVIFFTKEFPAMHPSASRAGRPFAARAPPFKRSGGAQAGLQVLINHPEEDREKSPTGLS